MLKSYLVHSENTLSLTQPQYHAITNRKLHFLKHCLLESNFFDVALRLDACVATGEVKF